MEKTQEGGQTEKHILALLKGGEESRGFPARHHFIHHAIGGHKDKHALRDYRTQFPVGKGRKRNATRSVNNEATEGSHGRSTHHTHSIMLPRAS